jgi:hypothetical protein
MDDWDEEPPRPIVSRKRLRKRRKDGWSRGDEGIFLKHLRATSNVRASARAAGKSPSSAYDLRDRDPTFAAQWTQAIAHAEMRLHGKLIVFAETGGKEVAPGEDGEPGEADLKDLDTDLAMKLIKYHQDSAATARRGRPRPQQASDEELTAVLLRLLDALGRRLRKQRV